MSLGTSIRPRNSSTDKLPLASAIVAKAKAGRHDIEEAHVAALSTCGKLDPKAAALMQNGARMLKEAHDLATAKLEWLNARTQSLIDSAHDPKSEKKLSDHQANVETLNELLAAIPEYLESVEAIYASST